jgi:hypothetical protein
LRTTELRVQPYPQSVVIAVSERHEVEVAQHLHTIW